MKYTIEMTGWEYHIQTKSLDTEQSEQGLFVNRLNILLTKHRMIGSAQKFLY